jgi:serine-type D-Ala-D-Ala carboxypeptidase (penicillin-binding protein 5/6)
MQGARRELTRRIKLLVAVSAAAVVAGAAAAPATPASSTTPAPEPPARAWVLVDASDGEALASRAPRRPAPVASATKLMTAYVARRELRLGERVVAPAYSAAPGESLVGLQEGERIRVRDLLRGLVLASGNDAAVALAEASAGTVPRFVEEMNAAAGELDLDQTRFSNPIGLDEPGNRSSPRDLATLAIELRRDPFFRRLFSRPQATLRSGARPRRVANRNELARAVPWVDGVKTGHTLQAGYVLVGSGTRQGVSLVSVVLGAPGEDARDAATRELLRYGFSLYRRHSPVARSQRLAEPGVRYRDETLPLVAARRLTVTLREGQEVETRVIAPEEVEGPVDRGQRLGRVLVLVDGESAGQAPLVAARAVPPGTLVERLDHALPGPRPVLWAAMVITLALGLGAAAVRLGSRRATRTDNLSGGESS